MGFRNFRIQIFLRVGGVLVACLALAYALATAHYLRAWYAGAALILTTLELIRYVEKFSRDFKAFLTSLLQRDFTTHFEAGQKGKVSRELYETLNSITRAFRDISTEKEIQHRFLEMLVQHLRVGIISFRQHGHVHLMNDAATGLLRTIKISHLDKLRTIYPSLVDALANIAPSETKLLTLHAGDQTLRLSLHASSFKLEDEHYTLVSMQNIRSELDMNEVEAWHKLMRVLVHEIMNSISPITSLSATLHGLVQQAADAAIAADMKIKLEQGLNAIRLRGDGLLHFTTAYRKLATVPQPSIKPVEANQLFQHVYTLHHQSLSEQAIQLVWHPTNVVLACDAELLEQVLINLLQNAATAVAHVENPRILLAARYDDDCPLITVSDNGAGIEETLLDKIFIPFFTTRKNGTGIGLALSKQILQLHGATIEAASRAGEGTTFTIRFLQSTARALRPGS